MIHVQLFLYFSTDIETPYLRFLFQLIILSKTQKLCFREFHENNYLQWISKSWQLQSNIFCILCLQPYHLTYIYSIFKDIVIQFSLSCSLLVVLEERCASNTTQSRQWNIWRFENPQQKPSSVAGIVNSDSLFIYMINAAVFRRLVAWNCNQGIRQLFGRQGFLQYCSSGSCFGTGKYKSNYSSRDKTFLFNAVDKLRNARRLVQRSWLNKVHSISWLCTERSANCWSTE